MKQIQISEELFTRLCGYHLLNRRDQLQETIIKQELQDKLERMNRRAEYIQNKQTGGRKHEEIKPGQNPNK